MGNSTTRILAILWNYFFFFFNFFSILFRDIYQKTLVLVFCLLRCFDFLILSSIKNSISGIVTVEFVYLQVQRPSRTAYFRIYSSNGILVYSKDASSYFDYRILPNNTVQMKLDKNVNFQEKMFYYVILGPGFAKRFESCGVESQALIDSNYWKFTISKTKNTLLSYVENNFFCFCFWYFLWKESFFKAFFG